MMKKYHTIDDVLRSPWASLEPPAAQETTDRVLRSTRLEDSIYADLREGDSGLDQIERNAEKKLQSFPTLKSARHSEALAKLREYLENRKQPIKENKEM